MFEKVNYKKCHICGKVFAVYDPTEYVWKYPKTANAKWFCGFNCRNVFLKEKQAKEEAKAEKRKAASEEKRKQRNERL